MTFLTRNFDPLTPLAPKFPNFAVQIGPYCFFAWNTLLPSSHMHMCYKIFTPLGYGCCLPKTTFRTKIGGGLARGTSKNWGPLHISATVEASNFKFGTQLGFGTSLPKTTFCTKIGGGLGQGSIQKIWDPYLFLQLLKIAISNLVHKLGLGLAYQKTTFRTKIGGGMG